MSIQKKISARKLKKQVGQNLQVMLEGPSKDTDLVWEARLQGMAPDIDGKVYVTEFEGVNDAADLPAPGTLATIETTEAKDYDLIGRVTNFESPRASRERPAPAPSIFPILA
jgi:ribosomal protein S12 methylthiotransferase